LYIRRTKLSIITDVIVISVTAYTVCNGSVFYTTTPTPIYLATTTSIMNIAIGLTITTVISDTLSLQVGGVGIS